MANLSRLVAALFSSHGLLSTSVAFQSFESGQALFLVILIVASHPQSVFPLSSVAEALYALSFPSK